MHKFSAADGVHWQPAALGAWERGHRPTLRFDEGGMPALPGVAKPGITIMKTTHKRARFKGVWSNNQPPSRPSPSGGRGNSPKPCASRAGCWFCSLPCRAGGLICRHSSRQRLAFALLKAWHQVDGNLQRQRVQGKFVLVL